MKELKAPTPRKKRVTRVRTGCMTCRGRRKKCDERKPECLNCERAGYHCQGYPTKLHWMKEGRNGDFRNRSTQVSQVATASTIIPTDTQLHISSPTHDLSPEASASNNIKIAPPLNGVDMDTLQLNGPIQNNCRQIEGRSPFDDSYIKAELVNDCQIWTRLPTPKKYAWESEYIEGDTGPMYISPAPCAESWGNLCLFCGQDGDDKHLNDGLCPGCTVCHDRYFQTRELAVLGYSYE